MNTSRRSFLLFLTSCALSPAYAKRLVRITNGEWPPYLSPELPYFGAVSRIVTDSFALQGITVRYGFFPWRRALALARSGQWDGAAVWLNNQERDRDFYVSDPVSYAEYVFFHRKDTSFDWSTLADLAHYRIGISNDYFYGEQFQAAVYDGRLNVDAVPSDEQNFRKLLWRRIDIFPMDRIAGYAMLYQHFAADEAELLTAHPKPLYSQSMHLLLSRKNPDNEQLMKEFNAGLHKLKASGQVDAYLREAIKLKSLAAAGK